MSAGREREPRPVRWCFELDDAGALVAYPRGLLDEHDADAAGGAAAFGVFTDEQLHVVDSFCPGVREVAQR